MTKFIELTENDESQFPSKLYINISSITTIQHTSLHKHVLVYTSVVNRGYLVKESLQEIKDLIEQAEQENPYRTK